MERARKRLELAVDFVDIPGNAAWIWRCGFPSHRRGAGSPRVLIAQGKLSHKLSSLPFDRTIDATELAWALDLFEYSFVPLEHLDAIELC